MRYMTKLKNKYTTTVVTKTEKYVMFTIADQNFGYCGSLTVAAEDYLIFKKVFEEKV